MKTLVLFTSTFPYGNGEVFIESEFPFLYNAFERIIIVTNELHNKNARSIPDNVIVLRYPYSSSITYKFKAIFSILSPIFTNETKFIREELRLSLLRSVLFTLLGSIAKSSETNDFIIYKLIKKYSLSLADTWFYSYWMNDMAIGLAMFKSNFPKAKTLCRAHRGDLYFYTTHDHYQPLRAFLLRHLNKCYVISENGYAYLSKLLGENRTSNVEVSKLGTLNPHKAARLIPNEVPILVSCSTLTLTKRVPLIAQALAKLNRIKLKWLHFGEGVLRTQIETATKKLLSDNRLIEYKLMGNLANNKLLKFYFENQVDLFINVSSSEGIPVSIMEAMSYGIPVLATAAGGTTEIVKNGVNGYLLNVIATKGEIAEAITKYLSLTNAQKNELSEGAYNTWNEQYNAEKNYTQFIVSLLSL